MKPNFKALFSLAAPLLMSANPYVISYSNALQFAVQAEVLATGTRSANAYSTAEDLMGTAILTYDLLYTGLPSYAQTNRPYLRYYSFNYRVDLYPVESARYKNGLWNMFTETGESHVKEAFMKVVLHDASSLTDYTDFENVAFISTNGDPFGATFDLCHPSYSSNSSFFGSYVTSGAYFYKDVNASGYTNLYPSHGLDYRVSMEYYSESADTQADTETCRTRVSFPNRPTKTANRSYVSVYGSQVFHSLADTINIDIVFSGKFIIAEGNFWGSCEGETGYDETNPIQISVDRPSVD